MLLARIWGDSAYRDPRTIDVHIRHLREKIERDPKEPEYLFTVRGVGYRFRDTEQPVGHARPCDLARQPAGAAVLRDHAAAIGVLYLYVVPPLQSRCNARSSRRWLATAHTFTCDQCDAGRRSCERRPTRRTRSQSIAGITGDRVTLLARQRLRRARSRASPTRATRSSSSRPAVPDRRHGAAVAPGGTGIELGPTGRVAEAAVPICSRTPTGAGRRLRRRLLRPAGRTSMRNVALVRHQILVAGVIALCSRCSLGVSSRGRSAAA